MSENQGNPQQGPPSRDQEIRAVLWDVMRRRGAGEKLSDTAVVAAHPDLMPELRAELAKVRLIERGQALAAELPHLSTDGSEDLTASRDPAAAGPGDANLPVIPGYRITGRLGFGGMGVVWRAIQLSTQRVVAIKVMSEVSMASQSRRERFLREIQLSVALEHPHIVRIYDGGFKNGLYFYAMEHIPGQHLDDFVAQRRLNRRQVVVLMLGVCRAVQFAHQHAIIHRDLKPSNILVTPDGQPHLVDFGLAKPLDHVDPEETTISREGEVAGTLAYMAPEQAAGRNTEVDTRADVYSLGVILYRLVTGCWPYDLSGSHAEVARRIAEGEVLRPRSANREVDSELEAVSIKALAREPDDRYATAAEFAQDLNNYLEGEPLSAKAPTTFYFLARRMRKYKGRVTLALVIIVALLIIVGVSARQVVVERNRAVTALAREKVARSGEQAALATATVQRGLAEAATSQSRERFSQIATANGEERLAAGEGGTAMLWFVEALRADAGKPERERLDRVRLGVLLRSNPRLERVWLDKSPSLHLHFLREGQALISVDEKGLFRIRSVDSGKDLIPPVDHHAGVGNVFVAPDESRIVTAAHDGMARVVDARTGAVLATFANEGPVYEAVLSQDGQHAMTWTTAGVLRWWDATTGKMLKEVDLGGHVADSGTLLADEHWLITDVSPDPIKRHKQRLRVWDVNTGQAAAATYDGGMVMAATIDHDGHLCIAEAVYPGAGVHYTLKRLGLTDGQPIGPEITLDTKFPPQGVDPEWIIYGDYLSRQAFDWFAWRPARAHLPALAEVNSLLDVSVDHRWLLGQASPENVQVWDVNDRHTTGPLLQHGNSVEADIVAHTMAPDQGLVATSTRYGLLRVWHVGGPPPALLLHDDIYECVSSDSRAVVTGNTHKVPSNIQVRDLQTGQSLGPILNPPEGLTHCAISPDVRLLVTTSMKEFHRPATKPSDAAAPARRPKADADRKGEFCAWEIATGRLVFRVERPEYYLERYAFDPAGRYLVLWGDGTRIVDMATFQLKSIPISGQPVVHATFNKDGSRLLTVQRPTENRITTQVWDTASWTPVGPVVNEPAGAQFAAISDDGKNVATFNNIDQYVELHDATAPPGTTGPATEPAHTPWPHFQPEAFGPARFATNGPITARRDGDGVRLFDTATGKPLGPRLRVTIQGGLHLAPGGKWLVIQEDVIVFKFSIWDTSTAAPVVSHYPGIFRQFTPDEDHAIITTERGVEVVDLSPDHHPLDDLSRTAQLLAGARFDSSYTPVTMPADAFQKAWARSLVPPP